MPFPKGKFYIRNHKNQGVLDDKDMSLQPGNPIIDYNYKSSGDNSNQLWTCPDGVRLLNVHSKLYFTFKIPKHESTATQEAQFDKGQQFKYNDGIISLVHHDDLVVGAWGQDVKIVKPDPPDPARRWDCVSVLH